MKNFVEVLKFRNESLFWFGVVFLLLTICFVILAATTSTKVLGINAWIKPIKFALSIAILCLTLAWFSGYLTQFNFHLFNLIIILTLGFEIIYISWQAGRGQLSHFNNQTTFYSAMYVLMAIAASVATLAVGRMGLEFFTGRIVVLPPAYLWAIRIGFILFVIFAFQGFAMGSRMSHTVGAPDGSEGIPVLNWSKKFGDLRIAHFFGMHALQILPLIAYFLIKNSRWMLVICGLYLVSTFWTLGRAFSGKPLISQRQTGQEIQEVSE